jgi:hypothetical protein
MKISKLCVFAFAAIVFITSNSFISSSARNMYDTYSVYGNSSWASWGMNVPSGYEAAYSGQLIGNYYYFPPFSVELDEIQFQRCDSDVIICFVVVEVQDGYPTGVIDVRDGLFIE